MAGTHFTGPVASENGFTQSAGDSALTGSLSVDNLKLDGNSLTSTSGAINLTPLAGQAIVLDTSVTVDGGAVDVTGDLDVDNLNLNGNTLSSTNTNGAINLTPNGTGAVVIGSNGASIKAIKSGTVSVTVSALAAAAEEDISLTITGAAAGDVVTLMPTDTAMETGLMISQPWVSAGNTVKVRATNVNAAAALAGTTQSWTYLWVDLT